MTDTWKDVRNREIDPESSETTPKKQQPSVHKPKPKVRASAKKAVFYPPPSSRPGLYEITQGIPNVCHDF